MKFLRMLTAFALVVLVSPGAFARDGGNSGGGGLFIELDVMAVRTYLYDNCERFESFKKQQVDCSVFKSKIDEVGSLGQGLSIQGEHLFLENGKPVDAINHLPANIQIGQPDWESAGGDFILKIGLEAHEFLSLMKIEHTEYYPVSSRLVSELRMSGGLTAVTTAAHDTLSWIRAQFANTQDIVVSFSGHDSISGKACNLFLTNHTSLSDHEEYTIVSALKQGKHDEDYIGMFTSASEGSISDSGISLHANHSWGNSTKYNSLTIKINLLGKPLSAVGKSDIKTIECVMDGSSN